MLHCGRRLGVGCGLALLLAATVAGIASAEEPASKFKPVPRMQVVPQPMQQAAIERDGDEISRYWFGSDLRRPFLFPLIGPAGHSLTRMGHPRDPDGHSHHNSVWLSHHDVKGVSFWGDGGKGRIVQQRVVQYEDNDTEALIQVHNAWKTDDGPKLLDEYRTLRFQPLTDGEWLLVIDVELAAAKEAVTLGKTPFGLLGVRMAKTIGVHDGGGTIRNSEGGVDEAGVFWKQARWVDYSGSITRDAREGITLFDHPSNPNHPSYFHVRNDGWMGAALTHEAPRTIEPGKPLRLRYGLWMHSGIPEPAAIEEQFERFAKMSDPPEVKKK